MGTSPRLRVVWLSLLVAVMLLAIAMVPAAQAAPDNAPTSTYSGGYWYIVRPGDTWTKLSARTGVSVGQLQAANPTHIHPHNWLYVGHKLWIPAGGPPPPPPPPPGGHWYTVKPGDTWYKLSARTGLTVGQLQAANPAHIHPHNWLYVGHKLWIPGGGPPPPPPPHVGYWYTVKPGDTWYKLSAWTGLSVWQLQAANPAHIHPHNWLYVGHKLWIPDP